MVGKPLESSSAKNESPSDRFWNTYLDAASREDEFLPTSWEANTSGILTFTGLFAATVAAFLIESYQSLSPNTGDETVALLRQLLLASTNTSTPTPADIDFAESFQASSTDIAVNSLWFSSLLISLTCALLSTLIQEWAREYRRDIKRRRTLDEGAQNRAHNHIYIRMGIDRYRMNGAVYLVTALVHLSVLLFVAGLIVFLFPINSAVAEVAVGVLAIPIMAYAVISVLPFIDRSCPYRTPTTYLIGVFLWVLLRIFPSMVSQRLKKMLLSAPSMLEITARSVSEHDSFLSPRRLAFAWDRTSLHMLKNKDQFLGLLAIMGSVVRYNIWDDAEAIGRIWGDEDFCKSLDRHSRSIFRPASLVGEPIDPVYFRAVATLFSGMFVFDDEHPNGYMRDWRAVVSLLAVLKTIGDIARNSNDAREKLAAQLCLANVVDHYIQARRLVRERGYHLPQEAFAGRPGDEDRYILSRDLLHLHPDLLSSCMPTLHVQHHEGDCCTLPSALSTESEEHVVASNILTVVTSLLEAESSVRDSVGLPEWLTRYGALRPHPKAHRSHLPSQQFIDVLHVAGLDGWLQPDGDFEISPSPTSAHHDFLAGKGEILVWNLYYLSHFVDWNAYHKLPATEKLPRGKLYTLASTFIAFNRASHAEDSSADAPPTRVVTKPKPRLLDVVIHRDRNHTASSPVSPKRERVGNAEGSGSHAPTAPVEKHGDAANAVLDRATASTPVTPSDLTRAALPVEGRRADNGAVEHSRVGQVVEPLVRGFDEGDGARHTERRQLRVTN